MAYQNKAANKNSKYGNKANAAPAEQAQTEYKSYCMNIYSGSVKSITPNEDGTRIKLVLAGGSKKTADGESTYYNYTAWLPVNGYTERFEEGTPVTIVYGHISTNIGEDGNQWHTLMSVKQYINQTAWGFSLINENEEEEEETPPPPPAKAKQQQYKQNKFSK